MQAFYETLRDRDNVFYINNNNYNYCMPHFHAMIEVLTIFEGSQTIQIGEDRQTLPVGSVCIADSYQPHSYVRSEAISSVIAVPTSFSLDFTRLKGDRRLGKTFVTDMNFALRVKELIQKISDASCPLKQKGYVNLLFSEALPLFGLAQKSSDKNENAVRGILAYLDENFLRGITLSQIARNFNYCPTHFSHLFHSLFGMNLSDYINLLRLQRLFYVKEQHPELSLCDLALECGFNSMPTFYRAFAKQYGTSPQKYFTLDSNQLHTIV